MQCSIDARILSRHPPEGNHREKHASSTTIRIAISSLCDGHIVSRRSEKSNQKHEGRGNPRPSHCQSSIALPTI